MSLGSVWCEGRFGSSVLGLFNLSYILHTLVAVHTRWLDVGVWAFGYYVSAQREKDEQSEKEAENKQ